MPMPIRLAVTLGPHVHELLAEPTGAARPIAPQQRRRRRRIGSPAWTRTTTAICRADEFLGTTEQFRQFDADGDGLLSVAEALKLGGGK